MPRTDGPWKPDPAAAGTAFWASITRQYRLHTFSNAALARALHVVWTHPDLSDMHSDLVKEAMERLEVWDEPAESIRARYDAHLESVLDGAELTDEDRAACERVFQEKVKPLLDRLRNEAK